MVTGCGGGGGGQTSIVQDPGNINPPGTLLEETTVSVKQGEPLKAEIKNFTVEAPATTFSAGSSVTLSEGSPSEKPTGVNMCTIVEVKSSTNVQGIVTISARETVQNRSIGGFIYLLLKRATDGSSKWISTNENSTGQFSIDPTNFVQDGANWVARIMIGKAELLPISTQTEMVEMVDDPIAGQKTNVLVIVHGFFDTVESFRLLAELERRKHQYRKIYGFEYDSRASCFVTQQSLANALNQLKNQGYTFDGLGHSMGAALLLYTIKHHDITNLNSFFGANGAFLGSRIASAGELLMRMQNGWINRMPGGLLIGWPTADVPSLKDMAPGSAFLTELQTGTRPATSADITLVASQEDDVVGFDSARARGIDLKLLTSGTVTIYPAYHGDHSYMLKDETGWEYFNACVSYMY